MKFEIYKSSPSITSLAAGSLVQQWRWRLRANNGEIIASGESYHNRTDCIHAINLVQGTSVNTPIIEVMS